MKKKLFYSIIGKSIAIAVGLAATVQFTRAQDNDSRWFYPDRFDRPNVLGNFDDRFRPPFFRPRPPYFPYHFPRDEFRRIEVRIISVQPATNTVQFQIRNNTSRTINLNNSAPWRIMNNRGQVVFTPIALQVITPLQPGESRSWTWDLRDNSGNRVPPGYYRVVFDQFGSSAWFFVR